MALLPAATHMSWVRLTVANMARSLAFYQEVVGLEQLDVEGDVMWLGNGATRLLGLSERPGWRSAPRSPGLFHVAYLVPSRAELARTFARLQRTGTPLQGFADHHVSESVYLADPDGHGIEIYRDRPREQWTDEQGNFIITTDPLDLPAVMAELVPGAPLDPSFAAGTVVGHVHLQVSQIAAAESFYLEQVGFSLMARYGKGASFISAGGYHHHVAINTWAGLGAPARPADRLGLVAYGVVLPARADQAALRQQLTAAGVATDDESGGFSSVDPSGNRVVFEAARA